MAITTFNDSSTTAASNIDVNGTSIQGTAPVSNFDNALRELMAIYRRDLDNGVVASTKSANYTALANDNNAILRFTGAYTLSLTAAATLGSRWHVFVVADGGDVIVDPNGAETINGAATLTVQNRSNVIVWCTGSAFFATPVNATLIGNNSYSGTATYTGGGAAVTLRSAAVGVGPAYIRFTDSAGTGLGSFGATTSTNELIFQRESVGTLTMSPVNGGTLQFLAGVTGSIGISSGSFFYNGVDIHAALTSMKANSLPFTKEYTSGAITIVSGAAISTVAHGLGASPKLTSLELVCVTGELGFGAGAVIAIDPHLQNSGTSAQGVVLNYDATNFSLRFGSAASAFSILNGSTGALAGITNANWTLRVRLFA